MTNVGTSEKFLTFLVFLWFPLSVGVIDYPFNIDFSFFLLQQIFVFLLYLILFVFFISHFAFVGLNFPFGIFLLFFLFVLSFVFNTLTFNGVVQFFVIASSVLWALFVSRLFSLGDLICIFDKSGRFFIAISVIYSVLFFDNSFSYVNDILSMSSFFEHKNSYGRFVFLSFFFFAFANLYERKIIFRLNFFLWALLFFILLYLSQSKSSIVLFFLIISAILIKRVLLLVNRFIPLLSISVFLIFLLFSLLWGYIHVDNLGSALDCLNVYDYFCIPGTGRLTIWDAMIYDALVNEVHLFGYGVGVFFATLDYSVLSSVGLGSFIPHDSHNGFVDLFVNFGLIGVILFLCIFILFYLSFLKVDDFSYLFGLIFLFVYIMSNISESYFLKGFNFLPVFFYILLFYYSKDGRIQK